MKRSLLWPLLLAICVLLAFGIWRQASGPSKEVDSAAVAPTRPTSKVAATTEATLERVPVVNSIVIVDQETRQPLPTASATWLEPTADQHTLSDAPFATADADGRVTLDVQQGEQRPLLLRARGHVPSIVEPLRQENAPVELQRSATLDLTVIDTKGQPVVNAMCVVAAHLLTDYSGSLTAVGIGHPLVPNPRWRSLTDALGTAHIDELPPGPYYLAVLCDSMFPIDETGANGHLDLAAGTQRLTVTLEEGEGVVFQCPSSSPVAKLVWSVNHTLLDTAPRVTARLGLVRQALVDRFPDTIVYAHRTLLRAKETPIRCFVALADGTLWKGDASLTPLSQIEAPVFLELEQGPMRPLTVQVADPNGKVYPDVPIVLRNRGGGMSLDAVTGEQILVPHGTYKINPKMDLAFYTAFQDFVITVDDNTPDVVTAKLEAPMSQVVVHVAYPSKEVLSVLSIHLDAEHDRGSAVVNYRPEHGDIRRWLPGSTITLRVTSVGYEDLEIPATRLDPEKATNITVTLTEKARRR